MHPDERTLGDAEMLLSGAFAPHRTFGAHIPLPRPVAEACLAHGGVVLVDQEGTPLASLAADGALEALGHPESGAFRHLRKGPAEVRGPLPRVGVLLERPLLSAEVSALAGIGTGSPVLLLVRTVDPQVPADVLVKATLAAATLIPGAEVVTIPFARRDDPAHDATASATVLGNYDAAPVDVLQDDSAWRRARSALDNDDGATLRELLDAASLPVLHQWRPLKSERGLVVFFTGLSGSGKSTIARALIDRLHETSRSVTALDGDVARHMLSSGLGFSRADRDTNIRRLGWVGAEAARHGGVAVVAPIAPFAETRAEVRRMAQAAGDFVLVWVATPLAECERRDRKGLYARARRGEIPDFTGISSPYEDPVDADLVLDTTDVSVEQAVDQIWAYLQTGGWLSQ